MNYFGSDEGWRSWLGEQPPDVLIQIARVGWHTPETLYRSEVSREANAAGLYWRLTGIGMQTILDGIMGSVLWKIAGRLLLWLVVGMAGAFLAIYVALHIYWK